MPESQESEKKRNWFARHKIITAILVLVVLGVIVSASGKGGDTPAPTTSTKSSVSSAPASSTAPKIGQAASDGKFTFTVNKFNCGETTVGTNQYLRATAQGQFCRLNLTIKNTGTESQDLSDSNQFVYDASGKKYTADSQAGIYAQPDSSSGTWLASINPGNSVTGDILFDVPKGTTPVTAELHDSAFSGGVKVSLQ